MHISTNPVWVATYLSSCDRFENISDALINEINRNLDHIFSNTPLVTIVIPAWNEEVNIVRTIYSLSASKCSIPFEIIVINNLSSDRTQEVLDRLHVKSYICNKQGCGPARQLGQEKAVGKYILMADADCFYPSGWVQRMVEELKKDNVVCVYGRYSFLATKDKQRWKLFLYECMRDIIAEFRHIKRPHLNALGMSMAYVKEFGLSVKFVERNIRGEAGRMCFDLMQFGEVRQIRDRSNRVWTLPRTLDKEGSLFKALIRRIFFEFSRFQIYFKKQESHNTKTSESSNSPANNNGVKDSSIVQKAD